MAQGKRINISFTLNCKGLLLALSTESKLLLMILKASTEKKAFARSIAAYHVPGDVLICSCKDTTSGTAAAISHYLTEFLIVNPSSPQSICLLHWPNRRMKGRCGGNHHPASLMSLMVALISTVPPGMGNWF